MYEFKPFNRKNFVESISTKFFPSDKAENDSHVDYLFDYLAHAELGAKSIINEPDYIDGDFLDDFASYYVSCFAEYPRRCRRLHFFSYDIADGEFEKLVGGTSDAATLDAIRKSYLGFIIVRPLPEAIVGRTQLKTFGPDGGRRHYRAIVDYSVHLLGIDLTVKSLAFQEQDSALAACATVALWSCFQKTSTLFGTAATRPSKITLDATLAFTDQRALPSNGLYVEQICSAIRLNGLDPEVFGTAAMKSAPVISLIYSYVEMGLPVLLIVDIEGLGSHALAVTGYSRLEAPVRQAEVTLEAKDGEPPLSGRRIDEFYAHDDQGGPFARVAIVSPAAQGDELYLTSSQWHKDDGAPRKLRPTHVMVPVYRKIRLNFLAALKLIGKINAVTEGLTKLLKHDGVEWDVHLTTTTDYKRTLRSSQDLKPGRVAHLLAMPQPRFFWQCQFRSSGKCLMEVLIDATGFSRSFPVLSINYHDEPFADLLIASINLPATTLLKDFKVLLRDEFDNINGPRIKSSNPTPESA